MSSIPVTALIADDESLLRQSLQTLLNELWPELQVVAQCEDGQQALEQAIAFKPDLLFLDINMPFLSGMEVAEQLMERAGETKPPLLVFVTAYNQFALDAFELSATDYLLKPLKKERLLETINRLKLRVAERATRSDAQALQRQVVKLKSALEGAEQKQYLQSLAVTVGQRRVLLDMAQVLCIQSDAKYSKLITHEREYLIRQSLTELEQQLDPELFWRIHRSTLLNISHLDYCTPTLTGRLEVSLKHHPLKLTVSRRYLGRFKGR